MLNFLNFNLYQQLVYSAKKIYLPNDGKKILNKIQ